MKRLALFLLFIALNSAWADPSDLRHDLLGAAKKLGHEDFTEREAALAKADKIIKGKRQEALGHLRDLWTEETNPEIKARLYGLAKNHFVRKKNAFFGFQFFLGQLLTLEGKACMGIVILDVVKETPAEKGGLKKGDLIFGIGDSLLPPNTSQEGVLTFFKQQPLGEKLNLRIRRQAEDLILPIQPEEKAPSREDEKLFEQEFLGWLLANQN